MDALQTVIKQFKLPVRSVRSVPESYSSTVYSLQLTDGQEVYIKIPYSKGKLYREAECLQVLQGKLNTPRVIDFWEGNDSFTGALLLESIDGEPCKGHIDERLSYEIGKSHATLHCISPELFSRDGNVERYEPEEWRSFIKEKFESFVKHTKTILSPPLFASSMAYFHDTFKTLPPPDGPCLIHMDFRPGNILVNNHKVAGIIDFESARIGSTENDFTKVNRDIWNKHPNSKRSYIEGYQSIRPMMDLTEVLPFYVFYDAFCSIGWSEIRGADKHEAFIHENLAILTSILS